MFSPNESAVLEIIARRKMTIAQIADRFYSVRALPLQSDNYIASVVRRIKKKCDYHKLPWTIDGQGGGRGGRTVWRAKRKGKR